MRILTLNCWGNFGPPERQTILRRSVASVRADLLLLQETPPELFEAVPLPVRLHAPESGLSILSRYPALREHRITLRTRSPSEDKPRELLAVHLRAGDLTLLAACTHLSWKAEDEPTRIGQVGEILQQLDTLSAVENAAPCPVLLGGDFNAESHHTPIRRLLQTGFVDLFAEKQPGMAGTTWDNRNPFIQGHSVRFGDRRIDYLFLRQNKNRLNCEAIELACDQPDPRSGLFPSDHSGVLARLAKHPA